MLEKILNLIKGKRLEQEASNYYEFEEDLEEDLEEDFEDEYDEIDPGFYRFAVTNNRNIRRRIKNSKGKSDQLVCRYWQNNNKTLKSRWHPVHCDFILIFCTTCDSWEDGLERSTS